jgi:hypothetical protein
VLWARRCMVDIRAQGRTVAGGWPGTRSEARLLVSQEVALSGSRPSHDELEQLVTDAYARARDTWLASTLREPKEPEG